MENTKAEIRPAKVLVHTSWKGGTGKTTLNILTAELLAEKGMRVLVIDLDSNCTISACYDALFKDITSRNLIIDTATTAPGDKESFKGVYHVKDNIDIIPADLKLGAINNIMSTQLKIALRKTGLLFQYDYIILDPPGYWGAHTMNAVYAADILVIPGACSRLDFEATQNYFQTLQNYCIDANTFVCVNSFNKTMNLPGMYEKYIETFSEYLVPEPIPCIPSLKKITNDTDYEIQATTKHRLEKYVEYITGGKNA